MEWLDDLKEILPVIFCRKDVGRLTNGIVSPNFLKNMDYLQKGPERILVGNKVVYSRESFISWLAARVKEPPRKKAPESKS